jgi:hypothetical protein
MISREFAGHSGGRLSFFFFWPFICVYVMCLYCIRAYRTVSKLYKLQKRAQLCARGGGVSYGLRLCGVGGCGNVLMRRGAIHPQRSMSPCLAEEFRHTEVVCSYIYMYNDERNGGAAVLCRDISDDERNGGAAVLC